jgi:ATP-dependent RNA helicase DeaD
LFADGVFQLSVINCGCIVVIASNCSTNSTGEVSSQSGSEVLFDSLGLSDKLLSLISANGYLKPTPVQAQCIPHILAGKDVLGLAQTGTGKTGAFVLPLIERVDVALKQPQIIVLAPTRELAQQVTKVWEAFAGAAPGLRVVSLYGGASMHSQLSDLRRGAQVVVGTPGRIMDHVRRNTLALDSIATVVLDEADEMLNMGFVEDIEWILGQTPADKQVALFSATMPSRIRSIASQHLRSPVEVRVKSSQTTASTIKQFYWLVSGVNRLDALTRVLEVEEVGGVLIFVRTKATTVEVADALVARGFSASAINGDMAQPMREQMISKLKNGDLSILVATDVAARGLDVERVGLVVNFELPGNSDTYVHRIGRTGRAGREGMAISFLSPKDRKYLRRLQEMSKGAISELTLPTKAQVVAARGNRFKAKVKGLFDGLRDKEFYLGIVNEIIAEQSVSAEDVAACLCAQAMPLPFSNMKETARREEFSDRPEPRRRDRREERGRDSWSDDWSDRRDSRGGRGGRNEQSAPRGSGRSSRWDEEGRASVRDSSGSRLSRATEAGMTRYKIEIGRDDAITPGAIVGSIADATGLRGSVIGRIEIMNAFSLVDLPDDLPRDVYRSFGNIWIQNRKKSLTEWRGSRDFQGEDSRSRSQGMDRYADREHRQSSARASSGRESGRGQFGEGSRPTSRSERPQPATSEAPKVRTKERWSQERKDAAKKIGGKTSPKSGSNRKSATKRSSSQKASRRS